MAVDAVPLVTRKKIYQILLRVRASKRYDKATSLGRLDANKRQEVETIEQAVGVKT